MENVAKAFGREKVFHLNRIQQYQPTWNILGRLIGSMKWDGTMEEYLTALESLLRPPFAFKCEGFVVEIWHGLREARYDNSKYTF